MTDRLSKACEDAIDRWVRDLFDRRAPSVTEAIAKLPLTEGFDFGRWTDREAVRKRVTSALAARQWFVQHRPEWAGELPLGITAIRRLQRDRISKISMVGYFAESLRLQQWPWKVHPTFADYACAVMAFKHAPGQLHLDPELYWTYSPQPLGAGDGKAYLRLGGKMWPLNTAPEAASSAA